MRHSPEHPYRETPSEEDIRRMDSERLKREREARREEYGRLFDQQVETLIGRGVADAAGIAPEAFHGMLGHLRDKVLELAREAPETKEGHIPFVIVLREEMLPLKKKVELMEVNGVKGYTAHESSAEFKTYGGVKIPESPAYLMVDVEVSEHSIGIRRVKMNKSIEEHFPGRSLLTAEEGVALVTQYPEILEQKITLAGSRFGNEKVPAVLYLSWGGGKKTPVLEAMDVRPWAHPVSCGKRVGP